MASFEQFADRLAARLQGQLPGVTAHQAMSPVPRARRPADREAAALRHAAVLALLFPAARRTHGAGHEAETPCLLLTRRSETVEHHKGQICLPGGALDPGESVLDAALREVQEELGIPFWEVRVLGSLTPLFVPISGFEIHPFVGCLSTAPHATPDPREVAECIKAPLVELFDPAAMRERTERRSGVQVRIPLFQVGRHQVWGATAMVLSELRAVL